MTTNHAAVQRARFYNQHLRNNDALRYSSSRDYSLRESYPSLRHYLLHDSALCARLPARRARHKACVRYSFTPIPTPRSPYVCVI